MRLWKGNWYLLSAILVVGLPGCSSGREKEIRSTLNKGAALVGDLPANPLGWKVITASIDKNDSSMSTLFGNDLAAGYARTNSLHEYPSGSVVSLVTWTQQEDARWFGGKIPGRPKSVEFVFVGATADGRASYSYQRYEGVPLKRSMDQQLSTANDRTMYLLSQRAAVMP
jgi:hypothetical protein